MRRPRKYRYWRRYRGITGIQLFLAAVPMAFFVFLIIFFRTLRPGLADYAENLIQYRVTMVMEQAVSDAVSENAADISALETLADGSAAALTTDSAAAERIRSAAVENTYRQLADLEEAHLTVPLGTLLDPQYLSGIGPRIPVGVVGLSSVSASVQSEFTASGVNQTKYGMNLELQTQVSLHALWCSRTVEVTNTYPLAEIILVGDVPSVYCSP